MVVEELYAQHQESVDAAVRLTCARWRLTGPEREDLAAELRVTILRHDGRVLRHFEGRSAIGTYLFTVLHRVAGKWIRARARQREREVLVGDGYQGLRGQSSIDRDPETAVVVRELNRKRLQALNAALVRLPKTERQVLKLRWHGLEVSVIAVRLGISVKSAEHRLYRGIDRLRRELSIPGPVEQRPQQDRPPVSAPEVCAHRSANLRVGS